MEERADDVEAGGVEDPPLERAPAGSAAAASRDTAPRPVAPVVVPRWVQAVVLPLALLGAYGLLRAAGPVALVFIVAALVALLLNPFVAMLQRARRPARARGGSASSSRSGRRAGVVGALLADPVADQASQFSDSVPGLVDDANAELADLQSLAGRPRHRRRDPAPGRDGARRRSATA